MSTPYGAWRSPITPDVLVQGAASISCLQYSAGSLWWLELRPDEGGRVQAIRQRLDGDGAPDGAPEELLEDPMSARTRVHEYGGGALWVHGTTAYVCSWEDQRIWCVPQDGPAAAITPEPTERHGDRYADGDTSPDGNWVACVRESHGRPGAAEAINEIVLVDATGATAPRVLVQGPDFVARPRWSPDGSFLAWLQWDHPDMPWDAASVKVVTIVNDGVADGDAQRVETLGAVRHVAGGEGEAVGEVAWDPEGRLWFVSDRSGWWNPWRLDDPGANDATAQQVIALEADCTLPHWVFGTSRLAFPGDGVALVAQRDGHDHLLWSPARDDVAFEWMDTPWTSLDGLTAVGERIAVLAATFTSEPEVQVVRRDGATGVQATVVRPARNLDIGEHWFSVPEHVTLPTADNDVTHALVYPPNNPEASPLPGELPPLMVMIHGGPTSAARSQLQLQIQFWTSRGFAVADVNYRGSVGYGRAYRHALDGRWGVADVADCVAVARSLAEEGRVDAERLAIRGGSAGGFTTLCALVFHDVFAVGCSSYGVADLSVLAADTHKFESRYLDRLVGPWPQARALYEERSPIHHTERLETPLLVLQGAQDEIVPPNQAELLVEALRDKGVPHAYVLFPDEQHGWRQASTIVRALEAELRFVAHVLGFEPAGAIASLEISGT